MRSTVCVIIFIHPHLTSYQSCGAGNLLGNQQMLCSSATAFMAVWFVEHLFSSVASVFFPTRSVKLFSSVQSSHQAVIIHPLQRFLSKLVLLMRRGSSVISFGSQKQKKAFYSHNLRMTKRKFGNLWVNIIDYHTIHMEGPSNASFFPTVHRYLGVKFHPVGAMRGSHLWHMPSSGYIGFGHLRGNSDRPVRCEKNIWHPLIRATFGCSWGCRINRAGWIFVFDMSMYSVWTGGHYCNSAQTIILLQKCEDQGCDTCPLTVCDILKVSAYLQCSL